MKQKLHSGSRLLSLGLCLLLVLSFVSFPQEAKADVVTDTLEVCVGYYGMELENYVTVGSYHWSELEQNLPIHEESYSYYSSGTFDDEYTAVVDTARGFYIRDLLDYADIYYGDIDTILFYVQDAQTIWTSFDRDSLFCDRYYFDDLPGHREILYGTTKQEIQIGEQPVTEMQQVFDPETGEPEVDADGNAVYAEVQTGTEPLYETQTVTDYTRIEGYDFSDAWNAATLVEPMLALEDNWASFNEEFQHIGPDASYMNTGSRFRLLFGQLTPTESRTHDSAKYVSRVYITLTGSPNITSDSLPTEFDNSIGSHELTVDVSNIYNQNMTDALRDYLDISSTDNNVLVIDGVDTYGTGYSDLARVTIRYSIIGTGNAGISMGIGSKELTGTSTDGNQVTLSQQIEKLSSTEPAAYDNTAGSGSRDASDNSTPVSDPQPAGTATDDLSDKAAETGQAAKSVQPAATAPSQQNTAAPAASSQPDTVESTGSTQTTVQAATSPQPSSAPAVDDNTEAASGTDTAVLTDASLEQEETETETETEPAQEDALLMAAGTDAYTGAGPAVNTVFVLSPGAASQDPLTESQSITAADEDVTALQVEDTSAEEEAEEKRMLLFTCLGMLALCLLGGSTEYLTFRLSLGHRRSENDSREKKTDAS